MYRKWQKKAGEHDVPKLRLGVMDRFPAVFARPSIPVFACFSRKHGLFTTAGLPRTYMEGGYSLITGAFSLWRDLVVFSRRVTYMEGGHPPGISENCTPSISCRFL
jgi:hypothetical protein